MPQSAIPSFERNAKTSFCPPVLARPSQSTLSPLLHPSLMNSQFDAQTEKNNTLKLNQIYGGHSLTDFEVTMHGYRNVTYFDVHSCPKHKSFIVTPGKWTRLQGGSKVDRQHSHKELKQLVADQAGLSSTNGVETHRLILRADGSFAFDAGENDSLRQALANAGLDVKSPRRLSVNRWKQLANGAYQASSSRPQATIQEEQIPPSVLSAFSELGLDETASPADVKKQYRRLARQNHPDYEGGDGQKMGVINAANTVLQRYFESKRANVN